MVAGRVLAPRRVVCLGALNLRSIQTKGGPDQDGTEDPKVDAKASLPLLQRCKNLLAANWRGQLSSVKAGEESVFGSLAHYALVRGQILLWLPNGSPHTANLLIDNRGSLVVGHTDPRPLIQTFKDMDTVPPRAAIIGQFDPISGSQMDYVNRRLLKLASSTKQAVENAGSSTASILKDAGNSVYAKINALEAMAHNSVDEFSVYSLSPRGCQYVDLTGGRHQVDVDDLAAATTDHLCPLLVGLIEGINRNDTRRLALMLFCAVYMSVRAEDAYIFAADRWGINVLAKAESSNTTGDEGKGGQSSSPSPAPTRGEWKEFRFAFSREVQNIEHFCLMLAEMEKECLDTLSRVRGLQAGSEKPLT